MEKKLFLTFNDYLKKNFGCKVYKVCVDGGFSCPNRDGSKGKEGCIFCDAQGSSSQTNCSSTPIHDQVVENIRIRKTRYRAKKFIVYFQSFTNTYKSPSILKKLYDEAVFADKDIVGLSIGTRSDCIDEEKIALIAEYKKFLPYVSIEYGMQTIHDKTLIRINRQETHNDFLSSLKISRKYDLEPVVHVILGLPGETTEDMLKTADTIRTLGIKGVKIHLLTALINTPLADLYKKGLWTPLTYEQYLPLICEFIARLPEDCVIYRFAGGGHPNDIIAPIWPHKQKNYLHKNIEEELIKRKSCQGSYLSSNFHDSCL